MNDNDLRALAAKLLKHYVADQNPVAEAIVAQIPLDRLPAKVIPLITAEQRALLDQLGGAWADIHENKNVALIAQGCGGCGSCGDGDGGGSDGNGGGEGGGSGGSMGDGMGDANSAAGEADAGTGLSAGEAAGWGGLGAGLGSQGAEGLAGLADGPDGPDAGLVGLTSDSLSLASPAELAAMANAPQGISADAYASLADQNAALSSTLGAVSAGLDTSAAAPETSSAPEAGPDVGTGPGSGGGGTSGILGSLGNAIGELFGVGTAEASPSTASYPATLTAAKNAAGRGEFDSWLNSLDPASRPGWVDANPDFVNSLRSTSNSIAAAKGQQAIYGSQPGPAATNVFGATYGPAATVQSAYGFNAFDPSATPGAPGLGSRSGSPAQNLAAAQTFTGAPQVSAAPVGSPFAPDMAPTITTTTSPGNLASPLGTLENEQVSALSDADRAALAQAQWTAAGRSGSPTDVQDLEQGLSMNTLDALAAQNAQAANTVGNVAAGLPSSTPSAFAPAVSPSAPSSQPTAMSSTSAQAQAPSYTGADNGTGSGGDIYVPPLTTGSQIIDLATFDPTATPTVTASGPAPDTATALRRYLGLTGDPTKYGFGAEQRFYGPAAAQGGYFNADQYFADGGLVSPMQPPSQPTVPPYPTMAFTDGEGPVGSIAQPPGLAASDAYGSDAPHASPMAPSIAASVPTMQPGLATLAMKNVNAAPAPSPISQNPNVGYAFGQSPLSKL